MGGGRPAKHQQQKSIEPILGTASPRSPSRSQSPDDPKGELQDCVLREQEQQVKSLVLFLQEKTIVEIYQCRQNPTVHHLHLNRTPGSTKNSLESDGLGHEAGQESRDDAGVGSLRRGREDLSEQVGHHHAVAIT